MAKYKGIFRLQGTLENMTFVHAKNGEVYVRRKSSLDKERVLHDPAFERTREHWNEFGHVSKTGKLIRKAIAPLLVYAKDGLVSSRLPKVLHQVLKFDTVSGKGQRKVSEALQHAEARALLAGFDFNKDAPLAQALLVPLTIDETQFSIYYSDFNPMRHIQALLGATHVGLQMAVSWIDFEAETSATFYSPMTYFAIEDASRTLALIPEAVTPGQGRILYFVMVAFFQQTQGELYPVQDGLKQSLGLIAVV